MRDVYVNFFPMQVLFGANASVLVQNNHNAPMGMGLGFAWEIHSIDWYPPPFADGASAIATFAISTRRGLTTMPVLTDKGTLAVFKTSLLWQTSGASYQVLPERTSWLPPVVLASPNMSLYAQVSATHASFNSKLVEARINFTMVELDKALYEELFQTWNLVG